MSSQPPYRRIIGTRVHCVTYDSALTEVVRLSKKREPSAVTASNTHLVSLARHNIDFHRVLESFRLILPDGTPLIWSLNAKGANLQDRVYGPYFMRHALQHAPKGSRHFFFGGTPSCLSRLTLAAKELNPDIQVVGTLSPPYRAWTEEDERDFARLIEESDADFIWVALGGGRQETWIARNLFRHRRGVFLAVGDAFELLGGSRPFAPAWMQKRGLTWLYRLLLEPRRLWARYVKFNSLFIFYTIRDNLLGTPLAWDPDRQKGKPSIAFIGSRGVPARYSGFEVVVEELGSRLAERGYDVTVYNRYPQFKVPGKVHRGMQIVEIPTIPSKNLETIVHTFLSALHAVCKRYDIIYLCGVGNALVGGLLRLLGFSLIINVDGADYRRAKWNGFARFWLRQSERWAAKLADALIADNQTIVQHYQEEYGAHPLYLSYGCTVRDEPVRVGDLEKWGLKPKGYILFVSRLTPENEADLLLRALQKTSIDLKVVICGGINYEHAYFRELEALADDRVIFTGARYGDSYLELSQNALFFVMPASIGATRLVLLDQMGMGAAIVYKDCAATREVLGDTGQPFSSENAVESLAARLTELAAQPEYCRHLGELAQQRARDHYDWTTVMRRYEELFAKFGVAAKAPAALPNR